MLDKGLADFCVQAFRFVYFNGYLLFRGIFSKLLPLKNVMRETQLQDIETISLLIGEGWVQALYILLGTHRDSVPVTSFSVAGEAPLRSIAHSLAQLHRRCQSQFEVTWQRSRSSVLLCHSPSMCSPACAMSQHGFFHRTWGLLHLALTISVRGIPVMRMAQCAFACCWGHGGGCLMLHIATGLQLTWVLWEMEGSQSLLCVMKFRFYSGICCVSLSSHVKLCIL